MIISPDWAHTQSCRKQVPVNAVKMWTKVWSGYRSTLNQRETQRGWSPHVMVKGTVSIFWVVREELGRWMENSRYRDGSL